MVENHNTNIKNVDKTYFFKYKIFCVYYDKYFGNISIEIFELKAQVYIRDKIIMKFKHLILSTVFLSLLNQSFATDEKKEIIKHETTKHTTPSLDEILPSNLTDEQKTEIKSFIQSTKLTLIKTQHDPKSMNEPVRDVGYTFPTLAPWCLLALEEIKNQSEKTGKRIPIGDWGGGYCYFSRDAIIFGALPNVLEKHKDIATIANNTIYTAKKFLPQDLRMDHLYKVFVDSVTNPAKNFMDRKNQINVSFNVIHHLNPEEADKLIHNMYENTLDNGLIFIVSATPYTSNINREIAIDYYKKRQEEGEKYPGFGLYNSAKRQNFLGGRIETMAHSVVPFVKKSHQHLEMAVDYSGIFPKNVKYEDIVYKNDYAYNYYYHLYNPMDHISLSNIIEQAGFTVLKSWYCGHDSSELFSPDSNNFKSKVVVIAKKIAK